MATTFNLSPTEKQGVLDFIVGNLNNPEVIRKAAQQYGATADDLASVTGLPVDQVHQYFLNAGVPMGTLLTGGVQRNFGTEGNIRQLDKGEDITVEKAIGRQGDKIVVQRYDAYGTPTTTRLADPNTSEGRGWLQALGIVGGAIGLSSIPEISSLFGGAEAATAAGSTAAPVGGTAAGGTTAAGSTAAGATAAEIAAGGTTAAGTTAAGTTATGLLGGESALAVAGVEGAASQAATSAYASTLASTGSASLAAIAADVASGNVAAGLSVADAVAAGTAAAADAAATGAVSSTGNVVGGGGNITTGATIGTGATVGSNLLSDAANAIKPASDAAKALLDPKTLGSLVNSGVNLNKDR
jgi:hypothetical protein